VTHPPPTGGPRVAGQDKETHPPIYLRRLTGVGNQARRRVTEMGKSADLRELTETGNHRSRVPAVRDGKGYVPHAHAASPCTGQVFTVSIRVHVLADRP